PQIWHNSLRENRSPALVIISPSDSPLPSSLGFGDVMLWYALPAASVRAQTFRDARSLGIKSSTDYTPSTRHSAGPEPPAQRGSLRQPTAVHFLLSQPGY